jgi:hypothetical protein
MAILDPSTQYGAFVPTNYVWDVQQIQEVEVTSPEFKELLVRLYQNVNNIALVLNVKTTGQFPLSETVNGNLWFSDPNNTSDTPLAPAQRQELQQTYLITSVGVSATIAHNIIITPVTTFTDMGGMANDQVGNNYWTLDTTATAANISLAISGADIVITNNTGITFTTVYIVLKYLQD